MSGTKSFKLPTLIFLALELLHMQPNLRISQLEAIANSQATGLPGSEWLPTSGRYLDCKKMDSDLDMDKI